MGEGQGKGGNGEWCVSLDVYEHIFQEERTQNSSNPVRCASSSAGVESILLWPTSSVVSFFCSSHMQRESSKSAAHPPSQAKRVTHAMRQAFEFRQPVVRQIQLVQICEGFQSLNLSQSIACKSASQRVLIPQARAGFTLYTQCP